MFFLVVLGLYTGNTCLREPYAMRFYLGICLRLGYVLGHCLRDASAKFFSFDALQLFCFTLKQISDAWVLVSFSFREGSETEEPQDVDEPATKESKLRTRWTDGAVGNSLGGAPLGGARSKRWTRRPAELNTRVTTWLKVYANAYAEATQRLRRSGPKQ